MLSGHRCSRDIEYFGPARDVVKLEAAEALGMPRDQLPDDPRVRASSPGGRLTRLRFGQMRS